MSKKYAGENTIQEVISKTKALLAGKQNTLVAGTNITIDPTTNTISATGGASITVDSALSSTSENPLQNKVVNSSLDTLSTRIAALERQITNMLNGTTTFTKVKTKVVDLVD